MSLSNRNSRRLATTAAMALAVAAMVVPAAQAKLTPAEKYGSPDPWAYNIIQQATPAAPFITEHAFGQNGNGRPSAGLYGSLDPWAYNVIQQGKPAVAPGTTAPARSGFNWHDTGIEAAAVLGLVLLAAGVLLAMRKRHTLPHLHS